jgi:lycopene cyclase domain-containing protein
VYALWSLVAAGVVVALELVWLRTGLFRQSSYWITMVIVWAFQIPVDGWLTKLSAPIVIYNDHDLSGLRVPWDIPIEDFIYGFALVTMVLLIWVALGRRAGGAGVGG